MSCLLSSVELTWKAGDTESFVINRLDPDRVPIDMTDGVATMSLRRKSTDANPALTITGEITVAEGKLTYTATSTETRALLNGKAKARYLFDSQILDSNGNTTTLVSGTITVSIDITR